jgi:hypothetical protein
VIVRSRFGVVLGEVVTGEWKVDEKGGMDDDVCL